MSRGASTPQDRVSVEKNKAFFAHNEVYRHNVAKLETYRNIQRVVNEEIRGVRRLLDVGNGGVFDYDTTLAAEIVGVDLFLDEAVPASLPRNVTLREGDALALDEPDASYDGVLQVFVLHHLVSSDVEGSIDNICTAIAEARRVLAPQGRLMIVESCVSARAYAVECRLFERLRALAATRLMRHPPTLQFPPELILGLLREQFDDVRMRRIPVGRVILQFGHRWPTLLTPARPYVFTAS